MLEMKIDTRKEGVRVVLCFAGLIKVLKFCTKPKVTNKALCGAVIKTIDDYYGDLLEVDDSKVSRLLSCTDNLSPVDVVEPARFVKPAHVSAGMTKYVLPLLDPERVPLAMLALQDMALNSIGEDESKIGRISRSDLMLMISFNPAEFLTDVLLYTAIEVENKIGSDTIGEVTREYVDSFEAYRDRIRIESTVIVEAEELECTLKDSDFDAVFREVDHGEALGLKNKSGISLYYLDISASAFDYMALNEYLFDSVGMYVYSRTQIQDFYDKKKVRSMGAKALRLMKANGRPDEKGTGNELGEMLLFAFMEEGLHAPKLLSKVEISTSASRFNSKSDCVHLLKRKVNGETNFQLVFGASSISGEIRDGIDAAFDVLAAIKTGKVTERQMVDSTLLNHTYDDETTAWLRQILVPSKARHAAPDMAFGVFIGYSLNVTADDNDTFRREAVKKMEADIKAAIPYIEQKAAELNLGMHSYYFYFLPFNDAEKDKKQIMDELLLGGVEDA